ncbi:MAG TPA: HAMP domain-containing histidine kinase [Spirochaetes bacterium]|nr:HAMP domain-containing histidine kinase [Spirochaetota bacterium]
MKFIEPGNRIGIEARIEDSRALIDVWDEGIGIAEEDLKKVFDPFEQVGHAGAGKPEGPVKACDFEKAY